MSDPSEAAVALERGGLAVLPTDTVYGLAARPDLPEATGRLFEAKGRPRALTLPVLVADLEAAEGVGVLGPPARALADRFWPGPLTIIVPRVEEARAWDLGDERATIGIRVPDHRVALQLLGSSGPLAVTSANRSGEPTPSTCDGVRKIFGDAVEVYLCNDPRPTGLPSTVVDLTAAEPRILREGALALAVVREAMSPEGGPA